MLQKVRHHGPVATWLGHQGGEDKRGLLCAKTYVVWSIARLAIYSPTKLLPRTYLQGNAYRYLRDGSIAHSQSNINCIPYHKPSRLHGLGCSALSKTYGCATVVFPRVKTKRQTVSKYYYGVFDLKNVKVFTCDRMRCSFMGVRMHLSSLLPRLTPRKYDIRISMNEYISLGISCLVGDPLLMYPYK